MVPEISARRLATTVMLNVQLNIAIGIEHSSETRDKPNQPDEPESRPNSTNQIGIEPIHRLDREGFDFVVDDHASCLAKAREDSFHNHLVAFPNFDLTETDDFQRAGLILQQKPIGWFTLPIRRELDVGDLAAYHHFLAVVLLGMGEELGDLQKTGCVNRQRYRDEGE